MGDRVDPVEGVSPADPVPPHGEPGMPMGARPKGISGVVVGVRARNVHHDGEHLLDVTVNGEEHTELVIRVTSGAVHGLKGKQVVVHVTGG